MTENDNYVAPNSNRAELPENNHRLHVLTEGFNTLLSSISDFAYTFDHEGRFLFANQRLLDLWRLKLEEVVGRNFYDLGYPSDLADKLHRQIQQVLDSGQSLTDQLIYISPKGSTTYYEHVFSPIVSADGKVEVVVGISRDITAQKQTENELENVRMMLAATLTSGEIGTWVWDCVNDKVIADRNLARLFAVSEEDAQGGRLEKYLSAIHMDDVERVSRTIREILELGDTYESVYRVFQKDGSLRWLVARGQVIRDEKGKPLMLPGVVIDITENKATEKKLRESEESYHMLFESIDEGFCLFELIYDDREKVTDYRFLEVNQSFKQQTGLEDVAGRLVSEVTPYIESYWIEAYDKVAKMGEPLRLENYNQATGRWYDVYASRVGGAGSRRIFAVFDDITERKRQETSRAFLTELRDNFTNLSSVDEIMQTVGAKIGAFLNIPYCHFMAIDEARDEVAYLARWNASGVLPLPDKVCLSEQITEDFRRLAHNGETVASNDTGVNPITRREANAAINAIAFITVPFLKNGEWKYQFSVHDIKPREWRKDEIELVQEIANQVIPRLEHIYADQILRESVEKYRTLFDSIDEGFCIIEMIYNEAGEPINWLFLESNPAFEKNNSIKDVTGKTILELAPGIEPKWFEIYNRVAQTGIPERFTEKSDALNVWFDIYAFRIGKPEEHRLAVLFNDISVRKKSEAALLDSKERYRSLLESIDEGFCVIEMVFDENGKGKDYRFHEVNPAFEKMTGISAVEALQGKTIREMVPDFEETFPEIYGRVALTGEPVHFVEGSEALNRWFDIHASRVGKPEDKTVAVLFNDITARRTAEIEREKLLKIVEAERSRLAYIFENAPAFVCVMSGAEHVYEITNPAYQQLIGHRDVIGKTIREALPDISGQGYYELLDKVYETGEPYIGRESVVELQSTPDGSIEKRILNFVYEPIYEADGTVSGIFTHGVDVTEQVEAKQAAENANRLKDEFLTTLSHELRTPLNAVLGWSQMLQARDFDADETKKALAVIERNARSQNQLIDDLLDVSRIITGKLRLDVRSVDLPSVISAAVETARQGAEAKGIRLQLLLDPQAGPISGDPERLQQVVWNLLSNAVKFTPKGGRIQVRLERVNSHIEITVSDTGKGIESDFLPHVFDRFRQSDGSMTRRHGGLGLGLAIVRQLVELHGGSVSAYSDGEDQGATFTINLPLLPLRSEPIGEIPRIHPAINQTETMTDCPPELEGLQILVVDDEADSRELVKAVLESCGSVVTKADSAAQALEIIGNTKIDVLISDIGMPEEDGFSLIGKIRELPKEEGGRIPAIALTAYASSEVRIQALRAGFQMHVPKPVEPSELIAVVANLTERTGSLE